MKCKLLNNLIIFLTQFIKQAQEFSYLITFYSYIVQSTYIRI